MKNIWKIVIVLLLVSAVVAVVAVKKAENKESQEPVLISAAMKPAEANDINVSVVKAIEPNNAPLVMEEKVVEPIKTLPRMIELGSDKCIPCKMMAPIIEELKKEYAGKLRFEFYDVWKNAEYGRKYAIRVIPTQVFVDAAGKELFRHEGFFSKEDILAKWKELGFDFGK
jgi:thioredoxin 1